MSDIAQSKWQLYADALERLGEALQRRDEHKEMLDVIVKRFEFCFALCWKTLKYAVRLEGDHTLITTPGNVLRHCVENGLVPDRHLAKRMLDDRNEAAHMYDYDKALEIAVRVPEYYELMCLIRDRLKPILCGEEET